MEDPEDGFDFLRRALGELFGDELRCGFPGLLFILMKMIEFDGPIVKKVSN